MSGPGIWGTGDSFEHKFPFTEPPAGFHVKLLHASGDQIAAPRGIPNAGAQAYTLIGLTSSKPGPSPFMDLGAKGCFLYKQMVVPGRIPIDQNLVKADLESDNLLIVKQAIYLNEYGPQAPIHLEATFVLTFAYVPDHKEPI